MGPDYRGFRRPAPPHPQVLGGVNPFGSVDKPDLVGVIAIGMESWRMILIGLSQAERKFSKSCVGRVGSKVRTRRIDMRRDIEWDLHGEGVRVR